MIILINFIGVIFYFEKLQNKFQRKRVPFNALPNAFNCFATGCQYPPRFGHSLAQRGPDLWGLAALRLGIITAHKAAFALQKLHGPGYIFTYRFFTLQIGNVTHYLFLAA